MYLSPNTLFYFSSFLAGAIAVAQDNPQPPDLLNITNALIANGVDPHASNLPAFLDLDSHSVEKSCELACKSLTVIFGKDAVSFAPPATYWSLQQSAVQPSCTFTPTTALEVSTTVLLARVFTCPFAVKSGGHAAFAGASSIEGGITVDLAGLNERKLSDDGKTVAIGSGNRWVDVYDYLTPYGLAVVGGRAASVGVGGLTLGGGISHHTNEYGLACDNIASYEVVTASGKIVVASEKEYPDLYWALRGGGNNFGIVVTFNYETFPQGLMFASKRTYNGTAIPALIDAFVDAVAGAEQDTRLAHFLAVAYNAGMHFASTEFEYTRPVDPANPPAILKEYLGVLPLQEKTQNTTLANTTYGLTESMPAGFRTTMWSQSFKVDALLMQRMSDEFFRVAPCIPGFAPSIAFQAFSVPALRAMQKKGGNALGLSPAQGPLFHALFYVSWTDAKDDEAIMKAAKEYMSRAVDIGRELGKGNDYVYMPYSSPYQAVVDGYGSANVERLKAIAEKYDPTGVWRKLQPGGFKLEGAPLGTAVP